MVMWCSELCNQAITNAFRECWAREQVQTSEETKLGAARCISYLRRILSIAPHSEWSTPAEILEARSIHTRYVVQLRVSTVVSLCHRTCSPVQCPCYEPKPHHSN